MPNLPYISPDLVKTYQDEISKRSSTSTVKRKSIALNRFFDWAKAEGHVESNPLETTQDASVVTHQNKSKGNIKARTWATVGLTTALVIILFLLTWKLKIPIPFIKNFAQENNNQVTQNITNVSPTSNTIPANSATIAAWNLYAKLQLTDVNGAPQVGAQTVNFNLYNQSTGGQPLYTSPTQTITTDSNGSALISLDQVPSNLFFQNNTLYLEPEVGSSATPSGTVTRIPISTANTAANLGGYFPANPEVGAGPENVPVIDSTGALELASQSPAVKAKEGNLLIEGQTVTLKATDGSGGNIEINPDANGYAHFLFEGNKGNFLNAQAPNLTNGSLYYGMVPNNATGYYLINLQSGAPTMTTKFSVDAVGNTNQTGNLSTTGTERLSSTGALQNITGYAQTSGNSTITQNPGDFASISKSGTALSDVLNLTLNENNIPGSHYSTLVINRYGGDDNSRALLVNSGNAQFNGQVQLGNYSTLPNAIGSGSLVFNTSDNNVYVWNGTSWVVVGSGGGGGPSSFDQITSGTNTTATMVVGAGASLSFTSGGQIIASEVNCSNCITNSDLQHSSINFAGDTGNFLVDLGGTENIIGTNGISTSQLGDTMTVTAQNATTSTVGVASFNPNFFTVSSGNVSIANNSLDFAQFKDAMTLDAATNIATNGLTLSTSGTGALNFASTGQVTFAGDVAVNTGNLTTTASTFNLANTGATTLNLGGAATTVSIGAATGTTTINNATTTLTGNLTVNGSTGISENGNGAGVTFFGSGNHTIQATSGTLKLGAVTLNGTVTGNTQNITNLGTVDFGTGNVQISGTNVGITTDTDLLTLASDLLTVNGGATVTGDTSVNGNTTLGTTSANTVTFNGRVNSSVIPSANATYDLGSASPALAWNNIYGVNIFGTNIRQNGYLVCDSSGANCPATGAVYWTESLGALYPTNNSVDLLIGSDSTSSAKFAFTGVSGGLPTASIAGNITNVATYITGNGNLATTNAQDLTLGGSSTGNVIINSRGSNALTANGANLTTTGTFTLPSNTLTGVTNYLQLSQGVSVGNGTTYYFDSTGNINAANLTVNGTTGITSTGNGAGITFSGTGTHTISASAGTLQLGAATLIGTITGNAQSVTNINTLDFGTGNVQISGTNVGLTTDTDLISLASNLLTVNGAATITDDGTIEGNTTLGTTVTNTVTFNGRVNSNIVPSANATYDLGSASPLLTWNNIYGVSLFQNGNPVCDSSGNNCPVGYWGQASGALYPLNSTVDLLIGANSTASAKFAFTGVNTGGTPTASIAGSIANVATYLTGNGNLATTNAQDLILGSSTTGNVIINSRGATSLSANGANLTAAGTLTFPNSNTLTGVTNYLELSQGVSVGNGTTYYFDSTGNINAANLTVNGTTGITSTGNGAGITFSGTGTHAITASAGTLELGAATLTGAVTGNAQNITNLGTVDFGTGNVQISGTNVGVTSDTDLLTLANNLLTVNGGATVTGDASINGNTTLGTTNANTVTFNGRVNSDIVPSANATYNLGSASPALAWNNIYGTAIFQGIHQVCDSSGLGCPAAAVSYWGQALGALFPLNSSVDLLIGANSTASAKFAFTGVNTGGTPTASIAGTLANAATFIDGNGNISTTNRGNLVLGNSTTYNSTGNILLNPNGGNVGIGTTTPAELLSLGLSGTTRGIFSLAGNTSGKVTVQPAAAAGTWSFTLPTSGGLSNQVLTTDGSGVTSWENIPLASNLLYYFQDTASDVAGYKKQLVTPYTPKTTLSFSGLTSGTTTLKNWITAPGSPGLISIPAGQFQFHVHAAQTSGSDTVQIYAELWEANSSGTDIAKIGTTETSTALTGSEAEYNLFFTTADDYVMGSSASRIVTRVYAVITGGGTDTLAIYYGDEADTHISLPSQTVDASNFVPYTGATANVNLGVYNLSASALYQNGFGVCDSSGNNCPSGSGVWAQTLGAIYPTNNTVDLLLGATAGSTATSSAKFAFTGVNTGGTPTASIAGTITNAATFIDGNGNISSTNRNNLTLGNSSTYNSTGNILLNPNGTGDVGIATLTPTATLDVAGNASISGTLAFRSGTGTIQTTAFSPLVIGGSTTGNITLNPSNGIAGGNVSPAVTDVTDLGTSSSLEFRNIHAQALYQGTYQVCDSSGSIAGCSRDNWNLDNANGVIYPISKTVDVLFGGSATTSAKFAFTGINTGGTPTASIAGSIGNVATYLTGNGNLATTNDQNLTLGSSTTGEVILNSGGSNALIASGANLTVAGTITMTGPNTITGLASYVQFSKGISVGNDTTYNFDQGGNVNALSLNASGTTGITSTGAGSGLTFSTGAGTHLISASAGTLELGATTLAGTISGNAQTITNLGTLDFGSGNTEISGQNVGVTTDTDLLGLSNDLLTVNGAATVLGNASVSGSLTFAGPQSIQTTSNSNLTIGGNTTGNIIVNPSNAAAGGNVSPAANNVTDLGTSSSLQFRNIYAQAFYQNGNAVCDVTGLGCPAGAGYWGESNGALYPNNNTVDLLLGATAGATATQSAKFAFTGVNTGGTPTASIAGTISNVATYLTGNGVLSTTNAQNLTLGSASTGNVIINSRGSAALTANGLNDTVGGSLYVGGGTTYSFTNTGVLNASQLQVTGIADAVQAYIKANSTQTSHLMEWQGSTGTPLSWIDGTGDIRIGSGASDNGSALDVAGAPGSSALAVFNSTGGTQNIIEADGASSPVMTLDRNGVLSLYNATSAITNTSGDITINAASNFDSFSGNNIGNIGTVTATNGIFSGAIQVAGSSLPSPTAYSRLGTDTVAFGGFTSGSSLLVSGNEEIDGILYLNHNSPTIANAAGTPAITLCTSGGTNCTTTPNALQNTLSAGSWLIKNQANTTSPALTVDQEEPGPIFTAQYLGSTKFTVNNDSSITLNGISSAPATTTAGTVYFNTTTTAVNGTDTGDLMVSGQDGAWHRVALDMTQYENTNAAVANGGTLTITAPITGGQPQNDLAAVGWVYNSANSVWQNISNFTHSIIQNLQNQWNEATATNSNIHTSVALSDIALSQSLNTGTGADGTGVVTSATVYLDTTSISGRSCADAVNYNVANGGLTSTSATLTTTPSAGCLNPGDEVLLINLQGTSSSTVNVGNYETLRVLSVSSNTVNFTTSKKYYYGDNATDDTNIGITSGTQRVMLQRVPNYTNVTIPVGDDLVTTGWNSTTKGGVVFFRATGTVSIAGQINMSNAGYTLGASAAKTYGNQGEGTAGNPQAGSSSNVGNGGGGGAGNGSCSGTLCASGGGGGGNSVAGTTGTNGSSATPGGTGGTAVGNTGLTDLYFGGGGGAGGGSSGSGVPGAGGYGGGIVVISAGTISVSGSITANGSAGGASAGYEGGGGGGAGGSIALSGQSVTVGSGLVTATAGAGGSNGGAGAPGRIAIYYGTSFSTSTNPSANTFVAPYYEYGVFNSAAIATPNAASLDTITWDAILNTYGNVRFQTRTGSSSDPTDGSWEAWQPALTNKNYVTMLNDANSAINWGVATPNTAGSLPSPRNTINATTGDITRSVTQFEDDKELTASNLTKLIASGFAQDTNASLTTSLASYWPLNETSGTRNDTFRTNNLTDSGSTSYTTGIVGNAANFAGTNLSCTDVACGGVTSDKLGLGSTDFSVSAWVKPTFKAPAQAIVTKGTTLLNYAYQLYVASESAAGTEGPAVFQIMDTTAGVGARAYLTASSSSTLTPGAWHHLVGTYSVSTHTVTLSVDNPASPITSSTTSGGTAASDGNSAFQIGAGGAVAATPIANTPLSTFLGAVDEVGVWHKVLSASEINDLYESNGTTGTGNTYPSANQYAQANVKLFSTDTASTLTTGLNGYWKMDETSAGSSPVTRADSFSSDDLTDNGNTSSTTGKINNAASFNGSSTYLSHADNATLETGAVSFSLNTWVNATSLPGSGSSTIIASKYTDATHREYLLILNNTAGTVRFCFQIYNSGGTLIGTQCANTFGTPSISTWYNVVAWYDNAGATVNMEVNNGAVDSSAVTAGQTPGATTGVFNIGAVNGSQIFNGAIDEVGFWKKVLSTQERTDLYNAGAGDAYGTINLTNTQYITFWVRASQPGNSVQFGFGNSVATTNVLPITIDAANTWQKVYYDLSAITAGNKNAVTVLRFTNLTQGANTIYIDNVRAENLYSTASGSQITSTPNNYIQYRVILTTTNTNYQPQLNSVNITYNDGYKITQAYSGGNNTITLTNSSGSTQNLKLDVNVFGADLAEYYTVGDEDQDIGAGDVVALTGQMDDQGVPILTKAHGATDPNLLGIISTQAGQTLGIQADNRRLLALAGRVPVKIDPSSAPINPGDGITASDMPGYARKAEPGETTIAKAFLPWSPGQGDTLLVIVNNSASSQSTYLTDIEDYQLVKDAATNIWNVSNKTTGEIANDAGAFANIIAANIQAGAITATDFATTNLNAGVALIDHLTTNNLAVNLISPIPSGTDVTVQIGSEATPSGQFVIQNASGSAVASIDNLGNATFSGTLRAGTIYADQIIGTEFATNSAQLQQIQDLLTQVQADQSTLKDSLSWNASSASDSANLNNLAVSDLYITDQAAINSLSVTTNFSLGTDFVLGASNNSIDTLSAPLRIQSLAMAPVEIMNGLVTIDTQGNVNIAGNLFVAGRINSSGLTLSAINPTTATDSANLLSLKDVNGNEVSSINASGSAAFNDLSTQGLTIAGANNATASAEVNGVINTNATVGTAVIPAHTADITINNPKVTDYTLVYVTPTSTTENYVLYVKSKQDGKFVVGFTNPIDVDVNFNWWIVQVSQ